MTTTTRPAARVARDTAQIPAPPVTRCGWITLPTGAQLYYERAGEGEPVLLLHGIAHSSRAWHRLFPALAHSHDVIALDMLGCGRSDKPDTDYSLGAQAATLRYVVEALDLDLLTVVGHSLGGGVAMTFAYHYPERVGRLALIASGGLGPELHALFRAASIPFVPGQVMRPLFSPTLRWPRNLLHGIARRAGADPFFFHKGEFREEIEELLVPMEDPAAQRAFLGMLRSASSMSGQAISALDRIGMAIFPVLIVWGREDEIFPVAHGERAASLIPDARLVVLDECGHFPQIEAAGRFNGAMHDWLAQTRPQRIDVRAVMHELNPELESA